MKIYYNNEYGNLELELIEKYHRVGEISSKNINNDLFIDLDIAEQITLITHNVNIQIGFVFPINGKGFIIHHKNSSMGAVCKIIKLKFTSKVNPENELELLNNRQRRML